MKKVFVIGVLLASATFAKSWTGVVSDAKCGASHAEKLNAGCVEKCVKGGQEAVFVVDGKVLKIANQKAVEGHLGHKIMVDGKLKGDVVTIKSVKMVS